MPALPALSTLDFLSRLGVGTHICYTDGRYADIGQVISDLNYLGLNQVRDASLDPGYDPVGQGHYAIAADAGIRFNFVVNPGRPVAQTIALNRAFALAHPGAVQSIEGPNEVNNQPVTYNGQTGAAAAQAYQSALYAAVKADSVLGSLPVYNFTDWPDMTGAADFANYHSYPKNGDQPWSELSGNYASQAAVMAGKPMVLTEVGYYTLPNGVGWGGIDQATQAKQTLNLIFDAIKLGVQKIYLYQLLDAYADPQSNDQEKHFGLFDINNQPKQAANAVRNLTSIFKQDASTKALADGADYQLTGLGENGSSLVFRKSATLYDIVVWAEPRIWDNATHKPLVAPARSVSLSLPTSAKLKVFDPLQSAKAVRSASGTRLDLDLGDHPLIIEVQSS